MQQQASVFLKKKNTYKALGGDYLNYKDFFKNYSLGACECLFTDL